jgi:hypothetical protein
MNRDAVTARLQRLAGMDTAFRTIGLRGWTMFSNICDISPNVEKWLFIEISLASFRKSSYFTKS